MEIIKREILLKGGSDYNLTILLTSTVKDLGFFNSFYDPYDAYGYGYTFLGIGEELLLDACYI
jgi:hypothetical protein